jgi:hypothetical protein
VLPVEWMFFPKVIPMCWPEAGVGWLTIGYDLVVALLNNNFLAAIYHLFPCMVLAANK